MTRNRDIVDLLKVMAIVGSIFAIGSCVTDVHAGQAVCAPTYSGVAHSAIATYGNTQYGSGQYDLGVNTPVLIRAGQQLIDEAYATQAFRASDEYQDYLDTKVKLAHEEGWRAGFEEGKKTVPVQTVPAAPPTPPPTADAWPGTPEHPAGWEPPKPKAPAGPVTPPLGPILPDPAHESNGVPAASPAPTADFSEAPPEKAKEWQEKHPTVVASCTKCHSGPNAKAGVHFDATFDWSNTEFANEKLGTVDEKMRLGDMPKGQPEGTRLPMSVRDAIMDELRGVASQAEGGTVGATAAGTLPGLADVGDKDKSPVPAAFSRLSLGGY